MRRAAITAMGTYVPEKVVTNDDLAKVMDASDEWIWERTMIRERHLRAEGETTSKLCLPAARQALERRGMDPADLDLIVVATVTPDMLFPNTANLLQDALGARKAGAMDVLAACPGFLYALTTGVGLVQAGIHERVLVVGGDAMSAIVDWDDRKTAVIFGDGAGAFLLEADEEGYGIHDILLGSDGAKGHNLLMPGGGSLHPATHDTVDAGMHYIQMNGREVYKYGVLKFVEVVEEICARNGLDPIDDIACHLFHQANGRMIESVVGRLGLDPAKAPINITKYGNTTDGTIGLLAEDADRAGLLVDGGWVLMTSFGAGFSWASILVKWCRK